MVRTSKPKQKATSVALLPYVQTKYSCLGRMLAKHIKSVGLLPRKISSFLHPVKEDLGLRTPGVHSTLVSVARCTLDCLVNRDQNKGARPIHMAWTPTQIGSGRT